MNDTPEDSAAKQRAHADKIALERHVAERLGLSRGDERDAIAGAKQLKEFAQRQFGAGDEQKPFKLVAEEVKLGNQGGQLPLGAGFGGAPGHQGAIAGGLTALLKNENGTYVLYQILYSSRTT